MLQVKCGATGKINLSGE